MIEIIKYKSVNKGSLIGVFSIRITKWNNFCIHKLSFFSKNDSKWISQPFVKYEKNNQTKYFSLCGFEDKEMNDTFKNEILSALEKYLESLKNLNE